ncbi:hypothetical protein ACI65C_004900 [Semiaphis heraclei]
MAEDPKQIAKSNSWIVFPRILAMVTPICATETFNSRATDSWDRWFDDSVLRIKLWQNNSSPKLQIPLKTNRHSTSCFIVRVCLNRHAHETNNINSAVNDSSVHMMLHCLKQQSLYF